MKNIGKKILICAIICGLLLSQPGGAALADAGESLDYAAISKMGWSISEQHVLTISEIHAEPGIGLLNNGWKEKRDGIERIEIINPDVTMYHEESSSQLSLSNCFSGMENLTSVKIRGLDVSKFVNFSYMFWGCRRLKTVSIDWKLGEKDVNLAALFKDCTELSSVDIGHWDVSGVDNMSEMFSDCKSLEELEVSKWEVGKVSEMKKMFSHCEKLSCVGLNLWSWDVKEGTDVFRMFDGCKNMACGCFAGNWGLTAEELDACFRGWNTYDWELWPEEYMEGVFDNRIGFEWRMAMPVRYVDYIEEKLDVNNKNKVVLMHNHGIQEHPHPDSENRILEPTDDIRLTVLKNPHADNKYNDIKDHTPCEGVTVSKNGDSSEINENGEAGQKESDSNQNGMVEIDNLSKGSYTFQKKGFVARNLTIDQIKSSTYIRMQQETDSCPVISGVWVNGYRDAMNQEIFVASSAQKKFALDVEIEWGKGSSGKIELRQEGSEPLAFQDGKLTVDISNCFNLSKPIYVYAKDQEGREIQQELYFRGSNDINVSVFPNFVSEQKSEDSEALSNLFYNKILPKLGSDDIPVSIEYGDGKINILIGLFDFESEYKDEAVDRDKAKKIFKSKVKELFSRQISADKAKEIAHSIQSLGKKVNSNFVVSANLTMEGYIEIPNGKLEEISGVVKAEGNMGTECSIPFSIGPVPCFLETGINGSIDVTLDFDKNGILPWSWSLGDKVMFPQTDDDGAEAKFGANIGVGVGINDIAYIKGGGMGTLTGIWKSLYEQPQQLKQSFEVVGQIDAYAKVGFLFFEKEGTWTLLKESEPMVKKEWTLPPTNKASGKKTGKMASFSLGDVEDYHLKDLSYLNRKSKIITSAGKKRKASGESSRNYTANVMKTNIYRESTPQMVSLKDGKRLAVWLDSESSDVNDISLYYMFYDGANWSTPKQVHNDYTMDYSPMLDVIDGTAYLTWQNASKRFQINKSDTLEDMPGDFDISVAKFDEEKGFSVDTIVNDHLDMMPCLCGDGSNLYVVWCNNERDCWLDYGKKNHSIYYSKIDGKNGIACEKPEKAYGDLDVVQSLTAEYDSKKSALNIAYSMERSGKGKTDGNGIYVNGQLLVSSDENVTCTAPIYFDHKLYWHCGRNIVDSDGNVLVENIPTNRFQLLKWGKNIAAVYARPNGVASVLQMSYMAQGKSSTVELSDGKQYIGAFSAIRDGENHLDVLTNATDIKVGDKGNGTGDPYADASLVYVSQNDRCETAVSDAWIDQASFYKKGILDINFTWANNGTLPVELGMAVIKDKNGNVLSSEIVYEQILPGEHREVSVPYCNKSSESEQDIVLEVLPYQQKEENKTDNSASLTMNYEDISLENIVYVNREDGVTTIVADVVNRGYETRKDVHVSLRKDSESGDAILSETIGEIHSFQRKTVSFDIKAQNDEMYYAVVEQADDYFISNNSDYVVICGKTGSKDDVTERPADKPTSNSDKNPAAGTVLSPSKGHGLYKVLAKGKTVAFYRENDKKAVKVVVPATVTINSVKYKVTAISDQAFSRCKKLKSVTIGKNVAKIGNKAFYGCKRLKTITIKTSKLKSKSVGSQAFKGINKKAVIKIPKKQKKTYKRWLKKKGITKKMKIK